MEEILDAVPGGRYPSCVEGERRAPPNDCGGPADYAGIVHALRDPAHPNHDDMVERFGRGFDPELFDPDAINAKLDALGIHA